MEPGPRAPSTRPQPPPPRPPRGWGCFIVWTFSARNGLEPKALAKRLIDNRRDRAAPVSPDTHRPVEQPSLRSPTHSKTTSVLGCFFVAEIGRWKFMDSRCFFATLNARRRPARASAPVTRDGELHALRDLVNAATHAARAAGGYQVSGKVSSAFGASGNTNRASNLRSSIPRAQSMRWPFRAAAPLAAGSMRRPENGSTCARRIGETARTVIRQTFQSRHFDVCDVAPARSPTQHSRKARAMEVQEQMSENQGQRPARCRPPRESQG